MVKPIPDGYSSITPYLIFEEAKSAIDFYVKAFGAQELFRMPMGDRIGHAEMQIGNSRIMFADAVWQMQGTLWPTSCRAASERHRQRTVVNVGRRVARVNTSSAYKNRHLW